MTSREIFQRYADERKAVTPAGYKADDIRGLTRYTPIRPNLDGIVMFSEHSESSIDEAIVIQVEYFKRIDRPFEWKVYDFDVPTDLAVRLEAHGFERGENEAFMVYDVHAHVPRTRRCDLRIERVAAAAGFRHIAIIQEQVWGKSFPWLETSLLESLENSAIYCAYIDEAPVGTGWIEFLAGTEFAELHGGSVLFGERGGGIYSALFDIRVEEAKLRGTKFLAVDAAPMSRPILLKKGFRDVCETLPLRRN